MPKCKILIWSLHEVMLNIFKPLENENVIVKTISEFGLSKDYNNNQEDFEDIMGQYPVNIIILYNITRRGLTFTVPSNIIVVTYCDNFIESFQFIGKDYFELLSPNDYLYIPALNIDTIDKESVLNNSKIGRQIITAPFVSENMNYFNSDEEIKINWIDDRFKSEVSIVASYNGTDYYNWYFDLNKNTPYGRAFMQFIGMIVPEIRKEIIQRETLILDLKWINKLTIKYFDKLKIWEYSKNHEKLLEIWNSAIRECVIFHEYVYCIVKWLTESGLNFKVWGSGWERIPVICNKSMGVVKERSLDLDKIYRNSKISVNPNALMAIHRRSLEIIRNRCLWMQADNNEKIMVSDFRPYFDDGKSVIAFKNKKELFDNIDYYLLHNDKREQVISEASNIVKRMGWNMETVVKEAFKVIIERINSEK